MREGSLPEDPATAGDAPGAATRRRFRLLLLFFVWWSTFGGKLYIGDAVGSLETARSLVRAGSLAIDPGVDTEGAFGPDGRFYAWFGLVPMLSQLPAAWLGSWVPGSLGGAEGGGELFSTRFLGSLAFLVAALLLAMLFERTTARLGWDEATRSASVLSLGLATPIWVYSGLDGPDLMLGLFLLGALSASLEDRPAAAGAAWSLAVATKFYAAASLPGLLAVLAWRRPGEVSRLLRFGAGAVPGLAAFLAFNQARFGSPLATGYPSAFSEHWVPFPMGLWGMWMSPGKGLVAYAPLVLLAVPGLPALGRKCPAALVGVAGIVVPLQVGISLAYDWAGDPGWGPRYAVATLPLLWLGLAAWLGEGGARGGAGRASFLGLAVLGAAVNGLGACQDVTAYSRALFSANKALELAPPTEYRGAQYVHLRAHYWVADLSPIRAHFRGVLAWFGGSRRMELSSGLFERRFEGRRYGLLEPKVLELPESGPDAWWIRYRGLAGSPGRSLLYALALLGWLGSGLAAWLAWRRGEVAAP